MKNKKYVTVRLEESLYKEIRVPLCDSENPEDALERAEKEIISAYKKGEITLTADDFNGITHVQTEYEDWSTAWHEI